MVVTFSMFDMNDVKDGVQFVCIVLGLLVLLVKVTIMPRSSHWRKGKKKES